MSVSDSALVEKRARSRDEKAFRRIVDSYDGVVFVSARRIPHSHADAEDVLLECFAIRARVR